MMSKTHLAIGMATALAVAPAVTKIDSVPDCLITVGFGAVGGVLADVDILDNDYKHDALFGELISFGILLLAFVIDFFAVGGACQYIANHKLLSIVGGIIFAVLWFIGFGTDHRKFTHSLVAAVLYSGCIALIYSSLSIVFACAYLSHLLLDILNKKKIQLFFPANAGICLKLCYANKSGNLSFMIIGFIATAILFVFRLITI